MKVKLLFPAVCLLMIAGCAPSPYNPNNPMAIPGSTPIPVTIGTAVGNSGSSLSTNASIVGVWSVVIVNNYTDHFTFYPDGTFSSQISCGTWSYSSPPNINITFTNGLYDNIVFTGTVNGNSMTGTGNDWTASRLNTVAYAYGYIQIIDNSVDAVEYNQWFGSDGQEEDIVDATVYDLGSIWYCVDGNTSYIKQVTTGSARLTCYGYGGQYAIEVNIPVYPGQVTTMTIPANWSYSALSAGGSAGSVSRSGIKESISPLINH
jgi:hypothetical protein